ncbi:MAG: DUF3429 domain-containing protein [Rickettsiales bacterium]
MKNSYKKITSFLTLAGTIPFLLYLFLKIQAEGGKICPCFKIEYLKTYSLMVIAFISGYIWSYAYQKKSSRLAFIAVVGSLVPWFNFMFNHSAHYFVVDMVYYVALLLIEGEKYDDHDSPKWYFRLRIITTLIVVLSLIGVTYL